MNQLQDDPDNNSYPEDLPTQSTFVTNEYPGELPEAGC